MAKEYKRISVEVDDDCPKRGDKIIIDFESHLPPSHELRSENRE